MKISEIITDKYKLSIPPTVYYDLLADVVEAEEEQEPCDDAISRQAVIALAKEECETAIIPYKRFVKGVNTLPSVYPQNTDVLDKIRAEILEEKECAYADFERYKVEYLGQDWEDVYDSLPQDDFRYGMERTIEIIDKFRKEEE